MKGRVPLTDRVRRLAGFAGCAVLVLFGLSAPAADQKTQAAEHGAPAGVSQKVQNDPILKAMQDELKRSGSLKLTDVDAPYYIDYSLYDGDSLSISATLGALTVSQHTPYRLPEVQVRLGSYALDSTNYYGPGSRGGNARMRGFPLDNDYVAMRNQFWLATDEAYKGAAEALARKRAALKSVTLTEQLPDLWKETPRQLILPVFKVAVDQAAWNERVQKLSAIFLDYPDIFESGVEFQAGQSAFYFANTEGTAIRSPESTMFVKITAETQATDGATLRDSESFYTIDFSRPPDEKAMETGILTMARNLTALVKAPVAENYVGPVLFEGRASSQLLAQLIGRNLTLLRRPVVDPGRSIPFQTSQLEGRLESRILPEWMDVDDDPTLKEWNGRPLIGRNNVDLEGVPPAPLHIVERGIFKAFLLTRQPVPGFSASNGRARLPGYLGANLSAFSNLIIRASQTVPPAELKQKLIQMCHDRQKPFGLIVRKLDFPSTADMGELQQMLARMAQSGGSAQPVSLPVMVYKVYPDGREELVRGLQFRGLSVRSLKDIVAASSESAAFDFLNNSAPFALWGGGSVVAETSVVAPSILVDDVELERQEGQLPNRPLVPAPPMTASR